MAQRARILWLPAVAALTAVAGCGSGAAPTAMRGHAAQRTEKVYVRPVTSTGAAVSGYRVTSHAAGASCEPGSEAIGNAYRCIAGNDLYDPCWAEKAAAPTVLCVADPWLRTAAELRVSSPLSPIPDEGGGSEPWGVQLAGGQRCVLTQGAHNAFDGHVIDYYCPSGLALLRGLDRTSGVWTVRSVVSKSGKPSAGPTEKIAIAWYGRPAQFQ